MTYTSVNNFAAQYGISERTARNYCAAGKIAGAFLTGKTWNIPEDSGLPSRKQSTKKEMPLLTALREQKASKRKSGIYRRTQIDLTYYSNHIAGNRLTRDQTRTIFENNAIGTTNGYVNVDDIFETTNHFRCIDMIIDRAGERLSEALIRDLHRMLKTGMSDSEACLPKELPHRITDLLAEYNDKKPKTFEDILDFHQRLDAIRPLWDGSGRVGRLIMFKECLANGFVPFIITDELKPFYAHGLQQWPVAKGDLMCICLTAQDRYKEELDYYGIKYSR